MEALTDFEIVDVPKFTEAQLAAKIDEKDIQIAFLKLQHEAECIKLETARITEGSKQLAALKQQQEAVVAKYISAHTLKMAEKDEEITTLKQQHEAAIKKSNDIAILKIAKKNEKIRQKDDELNRKDKELARRDEELAKRDEELAKRDEELAKRDEELANMTRELAEMDEDNAEKDEEIAQKNRDLDTLMENQEDVIAKYQQIYSTKMAEKNKEIAALKQKHQAEISACIEDANAERAKELERRRQIADSLGRYKMENQEAQKVTENIIKAKIAALTAQITEEHSTSTKLRDELAKERSNARKLRLELEKQMCENRAAAYDLEKKHKEKVASLELKVDNLKLALPNYDRYRENGYGYEDIL